MVDPAEGMFNIFSIEFIEIITEYPGIPDHPIMYIQVKFNRAAVFSPEDLLEIIFR